MTEPDRQLALEASTFLGHALDRLHTLPPPTDEVSLTLYENALFSLGEGADALVDLLTRTRTTALTNP